MENNCLQFFCGYTSVTAEKDQKSNIEHMLHFSESATGVSLFSMFILAKSRVCNEFLYFTELYDQRWFDPHRASLLSAAKVFLTFPDRLKVDRDSVLFIGI